MNDEMFNELMESVKEMDQIAKGKKKASRRFAFKEPEVKDIREQTGFIPNTVCTINRGQQTHFGELGAGAAAPDRPGPGIIEDSRNRSERGGTSLTQLNDTL